MEPPGGQGTSTRTGRSGQALAPPWARAGRASGAGAAASVQSVQLLERRLDAIVDRTAKLPRFELIKPPSVIGKNTVTNLQSGILYGHIGLVKYLIGRMKEELQQDCRVIATGGMAVLIREDAPEIDVLDGLLTLKGLRLIYQKNQ